MNKENANKHFPLFRYVYEEYVYGRDGGSEWADPENDIRKNQGLTYFRKANVDSEWVEIYSEGCGDVSYASHQAVMTLNKLQEVAEPSESDCMFLYHDTMFRLTHYFPDQKSVCGEAIDAHYYNDYEGDTSIKVDLIGSFINFYPKNQLAIENGRIYLNGELRQTKEQLEKIDIRYDQAQSMYPQEVANKIKEMFPEATEYKSWGGWGVLTK